MVNGIVVGIVKDNVDPDGLHRVLVEYPVESGDNTRVETTWCRISTPMGGPSRGLVMLPDIGTEVALAFAYRSLAPYVLGGLYNGAEDRPEPYANDDGNDDKRVFWSRNDNMVVFDDTAGQESVSIAARAPTRLDATSGPVHQVLHSATKVILSKSAGDTVVESTQTISLRCGKAFQVEASQKVDMSGGTKVVFDAGANLSMKAGATLSLKGGRVDINPPGATPAPLAPLPTPAHAHPPKR